MKVQGADVMHVMDVTYSQVSDQQYEAMKLGFAGLWALVRQNRSCLERLHGLNREINVYLTLKSWDTWIDFQALNIKFGTALATGNAFLQELDGLKTLTGLKDVDHSELSKYGEQLALEMKSSTIAALVAKFQKQTQTAHQQAEQAEQAEQAKSASLMAEIEAENLRLQNNQATAAGFLVHGDGTVTDIKSKLMWMQCADGQEGPNCRGQVLQYNWDMAERFPTHINKRSGFASYTDWRLPSALELQSLVRAESHPAICHEAFPNAPDATFWSSTQVKAGGRDAWNVYFGTGSLGANDKENSYAVRLVRTLT